MRKCVCEQCGHEFFENDSNPNIHYSMPSKLCFHCEVFNNSKPGDWVQDRDGNYHRK